MPRSPSWPVSLDINSELGNDSPNFTEDYDLATRPLQEFWHRFAEDIFGAYEDVTVIVPTHVSDLDGLVNEENANQKKTRKREPIILEFDYSGQPLLPEHEDFPATLIGLKDLIRVFVTQHYGMCPYLVIRSVV